MDKRPAGDVLTRNQVADMFAVDPGTVSKWVAAGQLPAFLTPGGQKRYRRADIEAFINGTTEAQQAS